MRNSLIYSHILRTAFECYMDMTINCFLNLAHVNFIEYHLHLFTLFLQLYYETDSDIIGSALTYAILAGQVLIFPILASCIIFKNFGKLKDEKFETKYIVLYDGLKTESRWHVILTLLLLLRRFLFGVTALLLPEYQVF